MRTVLVVTELVGGSLDDTAWELAGAARGFAKDSGDDWRIAAAVLGQRLDDSAAELARWFDDVFVFDHESLAVPDAEAYGAAIAPLLEREKPYLVLLPHTNNGMDLAPGLAVNSNKTLITDCLSLALNGDSLSAVRTMYSNKVQARVSAAPSPAGFMATVRPGAYPVPNTAPGAGGVIHRESLPTGFAPRRRFVRTVAPESGDVDITQAELIVSVGRGIGEQENLEIVERLAKAMGAALACSRPVVDKKWLPKARQVGTSGSTVKPKVYLAVGISGSFQHMGGLKGNPFVAAINSDPRAPIFGVANVGIVGDLFDIVPVLTEKIRALKN